MRSRKPGNCPREPESPTVQSGSLTCVGVDALPRQQLKGLRRTQQEIAFSAAKFTFLQFLRGRKRSPHILGDVAAGRTVSCGQQEAGAD